MTDNTYDESCANATTDQGLDPVVAAVNAEFGDGTATVEQTGGMIMVAYVPAPDGWRIGISCESDGVVCEWCAGEGCKSCGFTGLAEGAEPSYLLVAYRDAKDIGTVIADDAPLAHVNDYVRGFMRTHQGV